MPTSIRAVSVVTLAAATLATSLLAQQTSPSGPPGLPPGQASAQAPAVPPPRLPEVTYQDLLNGLKSTSRWLTYSGDYTGRRHSPLTQITPGNVNRLTTQWMFQGDTMPLGRGFEGTPLMLDGVLYITGNNNFAWAIDSRTGAQLWRYRRQLPTGLTYGGANIVNRGFAALGDRLFMATLDAHLIALHRDNGSLLWDVTLDDFKLGHAATVAPLVVKDKVIVGNSGGDLPTRGFIDAYDAQTGKRAWRFYTIPAPGEPGSETWSSAEVLPRGGGAAWTTGSFDPDLNLIYWGTGNPNPDYYGGDRLGDNLYTSSIVALDADTGKLRWHYQFSPHDTHDWDGNQIPVLADLTIRGERRKVAMVASRNGFFYVLDRATGELLLGKPFTGTQWAREIGKDGKPVILNLGVVPNDNPNAPTTCVPDLYGGTNFNPPSYDPALDLFFVMARETCALYTVQKQEMQPGRSFMSGGMRTLPEPSYSALRALDPKTGEMRWEQKVGTPNFAGVMSTASGLVFAGDNEGRLNAFESRTGKRLWSYRTGSRIYGAGPMSYMLDGRQYILIPSGVTIVAFALPER
jgi:alcohol dehydrogenase (cytochrome c)